MKNDADKAKLGPLVIKCFFALIFSFVLILHACGCGGRKTREKEGMPESVTAFQAVEYTKPAADKWQERNWVIFVREGDPQGVKPDGRARIWEVYYFSPRPEINSQMLVIYNRGNVWPNKPIRNRGGEEGRDVYRKNRPVRFRVDSGEAYRVAYRNGGAEFTKSEPGTKVSVILRCRADYEAVGEDMPAKDYKWIWTVVFRGPGTSNKTLKVLVDGMTGDYISKSTE